MLSMPKNMGERYSPLYVLASVGAGGLVVTFFMYLLYWVPHTGKPVPVFEDIMAHLATASLGAQALTVIAMAAIAYFPYLDVRLLVWNLSECALFKKTDAYINHQKTNAQTQVKAQALALAMTINVLFMVGLVFVSGLWSVVEYLFPLAILAFLAVGVLAFRNLGQFLSRVLVWLRAGLTALTITAFAGLCVFNDRHSDHDRAWRSGCAPRSRVAHFVWWPHFKQRYADVPHHADLDPVRVCPGIGFSVLFQFFINKGLVANGMLDKFSVAYMVLTGVAMASQLAMVWRLFKLNSQHFGAEARQVAVPAE